MVYIEDTATAAVAIAGANLFGGKYYQTSGSFRRVKALGLTGSAAAGDTNVELLYGTVKVGEFRNSTLGANITPKKDDMKIVNSDWVCDPGEPINFIVKTGASVNALFWAVDIQELS